MMSAICEWSSSNHRTSHALLVFISASALSVFCIRSYGYLLYPFYIVLYLWLVVYILLFSVLVHWQRNTAKPLLSSLQSMLPLFFGTVLVRLLFLGTDQVISLDPLWYLDFGKFMAMGSLPYLDFYFPYPPIFAYVIYPIALLFPSPDAFRILASILDGLIVIVLFKIVSHLADARWASVVAFAYAFLPLSIIESGWNGHFEPLANFFMLVAILLMMKKHYRLASVSAVLGAAVKIYPIFVLPVILLQAPKLRERAVSTVLAIAAGILSFAPVLILDALRSHSSLPAASSQGGSFSGIIGGVLEALLNVGSVYSYTGIFVVVFVCIGTIFIILSANGERRMPYTGDFRRGGFVLGAIFIATGLIAGVFPFTSMTNQFNWQFPWDIAMIRGLTTCIWGVVVVIIVYKTKAIYSSFHGHAPVLAVFLTAIVVLLSAFMRVVFFGWYLLWSLPLFLLVPRRYLAVMAVLGLVLLYPNYTDQYFTGLGFDETKSWEQPLNSLDAWQTSVYSGPSADVPNITFGVTVMNEFTRFWANLSSLSSQSMPANLTIIFHAHYRFEYDLGTIFRTKIRTSWDPTFGRMSEISLSFDGLDLSSQHTSGTIIPRSGLFTNLTETSWTYSFSSEMGSYTNGVVKNITLSMYPLTKGYYFYDVDAFYTLEGNIHHPLDFLIVPLLVALPLLSCVVLFREVEDYEKQTSISTQDGP